MTRPQITFLNASKRVSHSSCSVIESRCTHRYPLVTARAFGDTIALLLAFIVARRSKASPCDRQCLHINISEPWLAYTVWTDIYGGSHILVVRDSTRQLNISGDLNHLIRVRLVVLEVVVINSDKIAMLDQRCVIYSDRLVLAMNKLYGVYWNTVTLRYASAPGSHRKISIPSCIASRFLRQREIYLHRARTLTSLLSDPQGFEAHIQGKYYGGPMDTKCSQIMIVSVVTQLVEILINGQTPQRAVILSAFPFRKLTSIPSSVGWGFFSWTYHRLVSRCKRDALYPRKLA
ncbi:hypothetical protein BDR03DRAFT_424700 [Suillus americanus]|nr:hypothetical protein BDR03DRAFT_424700 [Suillus americanus]